MDEQGQKVMMIIAMEPYSYDIKMRMVWVDLNYA